MMTFEHLLVETALDIQLDRHVFRLESRLEPEAAAVSAEAHNVLTFTIPNVVAGVALLRQGLAQGPLDQQIAQVNRWLSLLNTRVNVVFLGQTLLSVGQGANGGGWRKLLSTFPLNE